MSVTASNPANARRSPARKPATKASAVVATAKVARARGAPAHAGLSSPWSQLMLGRTMTGLMAHDLVTTGVSVAAVKQVLAAFNTITAAQIYDVLGISAKTLQRRSANAAKTLDPNASDRALRLVSVTSQAIDVLGSLEAAERWLQSPAIGLDRRKPIDLLRSTEGTEMVKTLLTRMDYGVYA